MVIEAVVVALTLFKIFQYYKDVPRRTRKLLDVLWIDGLMYFVFMLRKSSSPHLRHSSNRLYVVIGILNVGLVLHDSNPNLYIGLPELQAVFHSILSTRIVLHTAEVLRQDIVDSRAAVAQDRLSTRVEFARATIEIVTK
ncbi:hypothetical protein BC826DRAFT_137394 [Russula brevipes]|nr:hypothetical protein BC826DRAFT_137394 [Russula brevipes]